MDNNFNKMIEEYLHQGKSYDDITKMFNEAARQTKEKDAMNTRTTFIHGLYDDIDDALEMSGYSFKLAGEVALAAMIDNHPEWTVEQCKIVIKSIQDDCKTVEKLVSGKQDEVFDEIFGKMFQPKKTDSTLNTADNKKDFDKFLAEFVKSL